MLANSTNCCRFSDAEVQRDAKLVSYEIVDKQTKPYIQGVCVHGAAAAVRLAAVEGMDVSGRHREWWQWLLTCPVLAFLTPFLLPLAVMAGPKRAPYHTHDC